MEISIITRSYHHVNVFLGDFGSLRASRKSVSTSARCERAFAIVSRSSFRDSLVSTSTEALLICRIPSGGR